MAPAMLTAEQAAVLHPAPEMTATKIARLRLLAVDANPKIRESVASSYHTPEDVFVALARDLAMHVCAMSPTSINNEDGTGEETALLNQSFIKNPDMTVKQRLDGAVQKFGENTQVVRFMRYSIEG